MLKKFAKSALGRMFVATGRFREKIASQSTIVAFHRVNDIPVDDSLTVSPATFEEFCTFFKAHFDVVPLAEQVRAVRAGQPRGGSLSITFDDGYRDNFAIAAPILKKLGLPATFFVTTGFVQSETVPFWDRNLSPQPGWMSWEEVRSLKAQGFEIGCHTQTHLDMGSAPAEQIRVELRQSRAILEQQVQAPVTLFAYPFGGRKNINPTSESLVREEGFECCVSCCGGINQGHVDPFKLNRLPISGWFPTPMHMAAEMVLGKI
jgi:peptidoglycan/xylan/chitin deacetylase (PgdA/CDA1 family)